ncbi:ABC transporter permease [Mesonia aestuariivivens]|uniref:ABC transporter permease n=1 Tax=Mesonia aestuariivivens TaxID=2796128 RepID=A0ABS6W159_9FLAO|nr:ABC transporter permease [Mesonia aestuariivivens]MBW2961595.1 ABC transporter permease [Mesonia aestuariivivens]
MNFSYYIAKRYLFTKSKNNAINIITIIASIGVFAGAMALFIVLSGFAGLKEFSLSFSNKFDPDLKVLPKTGKYFTYTPEQQKQLKNITDIQVASKTIEERVLLNFRDKNVPSSYLKGVDENYLKVNAVDSALLAGTWLHQKEKQVVIGNGISRKLSIGVAGYGDVLKIFVPRPGKGQVSNPSEAFNTISSMAIGIYSINEELDQKYVYAPFSLAQNLLELKPNEVSAIELSLTPNASESSTRKAIQEIFNHEVIIKDRVQLNDKLYKMLNTENLAVYLIFTLILIIALFNVGGAIVMSILDKQNNIKTLSNLGANLHQIRRVFFLQGTLLTFTGGVFGLIVACLIILLQQQFSLVMITPSLAYPVLFEAKNLIIVFATIMTLGIIASYIGSTRIKKVIEMKA